MNRPVVSFLSLGCRVNQYEIRRFIERLYPLVDIIDFGQPADVTVIDTCVVTRTAERDTRQMIPRARRFSPEGLIVLTGCYVDIHPEPAREIEPGVVVFPRDRKAEIPGWIAGRFDLGPLVETAGAPPLWPSAGRPPLMVQNGCDNRCAYCVIPLARGPSVSRPPEDVLAELDRFFADPVAEVVLSGINLGAWGRDLQPRREIAGLVARLLDRTPEGRRIRLGSVEPETVDPGLVALLGHPRLAPHLHLPLQGTTDTTLSAMRRPNRTGTYLELVASVRAAAPGCAIGADVIAGFPGETEEAFSDGLEFVRRCGFSYLHVFPFSARPGTAAASMKALPAEIVKARAARLRQVAAGLRASFLAGQQGRTVEVAVEETGADGVASGMAGPFFQVRFPALAPMSPGLVDVRCVRQEGDGFAGELACAQKPT
ncbi:MAG: tRNA (N(6)-L-threonylcarbamoyladenosine(37)-C(2))-methylthiotransferase MtaB [Deltaproteobacteria bacterium HGW-Deltaproteobacteria-17]|nr:MAG: tRNA (N(6)-L-threonylcarbamoyladenosine(37)-C(2))-methylthiotransferase MtaB [Deltaproteobacteria bacterium HGW-Deltaproteobacteria-17]